MEAAHHAPEIHRIGDLVVRPGDSLALANGRPLTLSVREFQLLVAFARRTGRIVTREELHDAVWGGEFRKDDRSVDVYVHKLRAKLDDAFPGRRYIHTHFGFGYRFACEPSHPFHISATSPQQTAAEPVEASPHSNQPKETT